MIFIDSREPKYIKERLEAVITIQTAHLPAGDYQIGDLLIERKTLKDFLASVFDKRIFEQVKRMKEYTKSVIIAVIGHWDGLKSIDFVKYKILMSTIATLTLKFGISVITFNDEIDFFEFIMHIDKISETSNSDYSPFKKRKAKNEYEQALNVLIAFPRIGIKTAKYLLSKYKSIKNIIESDDKKAKKIIELINKEVV